MEVLLAFSRLASLPDRTRREVDNRQQLPKQWRLLVALGKLLVALGEALEGLVLQWLLQSAREGSGNIYLHKVAPLYSGTQQLCF